MNSKKKSRKRELAAKKILLINGITARDGCIHIVTSACKMSSIFQQGGAL